METEASGLPVALLGLALDAGRLHLFLRMPAARRGKKRGPLSSLERRPAPCVLLLPSWLLIAVVTWMLIAVVNLGWAGASRGERAASVTCMAALRRGFCAAVGRHRFRFDEMLEPKCHHNMQHYYSAFRLARSLLFALFALYQTSRTSYICPHSFC